MNMTLLAAAMIPLFAATPFPQPQGDPPPEPPQEPQTEALPLPESPAPAPLALVGATVHSMVQGQAAFEATVLIEERVITAIGPQLEVPTGFERVDLSGRHLLPGLIDGMANHDPDHDLLYVEAGVTLVRDNGNERLRILQERLAPMRDRNPGPDLFIAGLILDGNPPATLHAVVLDNELMAAEKLPRLLEDQPDFFSINRGVPLGALRRAIQVAHENGIEVWGYLPAEASFEVAVQARMDGFFGLDPFLDVGQRWDQIDVESLTSRIALASEEQLEVTPLLCALAASLVESREDPDGLDLLGPHYLPPWRQRVREITDGMSDELRALVREALKRQGNLLRRLHEDGVAIVPGSAAPNPLLMPGQGLHDELALLQQAGFSASEVITLATAGAARALGIGQQRGTIEVGRLADLLVVEGDPRQELSLLRHPSEVVLRGRRLTRAEIDEKREKLRELQAQRLAEISRPLNVAAPRAPEGQVLLQARFEANALGLRTQEEHVLVVRETDGHIAYCTRLESAGGVSTQKLSVELCQRFLEGQMESFELTYELGETGGPEGGPQELSVKGLRLGTSMNIERRVGGAFLDNQRANRSIDVIDIGSVLTEIIVGQHWDPGLHYGIYFEELTPVESQWTLQIDEKDHRFLIRSPDGPQHFGLDERGIPVFSARRAGNASRELRVLSVEEQEGHGLTLDEERRFVLPPSAEGGGDGGVDRDR